MQDHANNSTQYLRDFSFLMLKISAKFEQGDPTDIPNTGGVCYNWRLLTKITPYNLKTSTVASVGILVRSQVYHTERPPLFAARLP